ncbi:MAG: exodeoxyribonuclease VII large subunit [Pseudomonadota bacterium]
MDLIDDDEAGGPGANAPEFTVSELSGAIKRSVEQGFPHVRVRGELGRVSRPSSGHLYLDLKDDRAVLSAVIWRGTAQGLRTKPEQGMEVVATGRITTFPGQSRYQLVIESLAPAGLGALMALLERRKKALEAEGLFAADRKRPVPYLPEVIGVVTSPSGAVIRDILHRLRDRFPRHVLVWPVSVQGERCAPEVAEAIRGFNALPRGGPVPRPDVLIVARGGGSVEDLWGFNEEAVVRAAADSAIPLISAVGHETDTTLIDLAADLRAPTPTAAAELAVPVRLDLMAALAGLEERRRSGLARGLSDRRRRLRDLGRLLPRPETILAERVQRLDEFAQRLPRGLTAALQARRLAFERRAGRFGPQLMRWVVDQRRAMRDRSVAGRFGPALLAALLRDARRRLEATGGRVSLAPLHRSHSTARAGVSALEERLLRAGSGRLEADRARLNAQARVLETLSHKRTLARGFALVRTEEGQLVATAEDARAQARLRVTFRDDDVLLVPDPGPASAPAPRRPRGQKPAAQQGETRDTGAPERSGGGQGELF